MSEQEDLELEALQRQLDDAFETTRPRRDFEDELWLRMQAKRPLAGRLREALATLVAGVRQAPAIPMGAVAVLLVVVIGAGILINSGLGLNKSTHGTYSQANAPDLALGGTYGRLPSPQLHPGVVDTGVPNGLSQSPRVPAPQAPSNLYFGPATLRWTGQLPLGSIQAPVYRYVEPSVADAERFAASIGASTSSPGQATAGFLGTYNGQNFSVSIRGSVPQLPREPIYVLSPASPFGGAGTEPEAVATSFLGQYSLAPSLPYAFTVQKGGAQTRVQFQRAFSLASGGQAYVIDWNGERYGIEVDLQNSQVIAATGPMPLSLESTNYQLISNDDAVRLALAATPATSQALQPQPAIDLSKVELVYALAISGNQGFYEPAYLFSGTFTYNGQTYTKRVLVPLVDPNLRS